MTNQYFKSLPKPNQQPSSLKKITSLILLHCLQPHNLIKKPNRNPLPNYPKHLELNSNPNIHTS